MSFTLEDFALFTHIDPAGFMGVKITKGVSCDPFDCQKRNYFVNAFKTAERRINALLKDRGAMSLSGDVATLQSSASYFKLKPGWDPLTLKTYEVQATVEFPADLTKKFKVRERVTLTSETLPDWEDCESFYDVRVVFPTAECSRFDVALRDVTVLAEGEDVITRTLTATAQAANFLDIDRAVDCAECVNDASAVYFDEVTLVIRTKQKGKARVFWPVPVASPCGECDPCTEEVSEPDPCDDCCADTYTQACVRVSPARIATVEQVIYPCFVTALPIKYELDIVNKALFDEGWAEAVAWLGMTNIGVEMCDVCNSIPQTLWAEANGTDPRYQNSNTYQQWSRIFGVAKPGAQRAGAIVSAALNRVGLGVM